MQDLTILLINVTCTVCLKNKKCPKVSCKAFEVVAKSGPDACPKCMDKKVAESHNAVMADVLLTNKRPTECPMIMCLKPKCKRWEMLVNYTDENGCPACSRCAARNTNCIVPPCPTFPVICPKGKIYGPSVDRFGCSLCPHCIAHPSKAVGTESDKPFSCKKRDCPPIAACKAGFEKVIKFNKKGYVSTRYLHFSQTMILLTFFY